MNPGPSRRLGSATRVRAVVAQAGSAIGPVWSPVVVAWAWGEADGAEVGERQRLAGTTDPARRGRLDDPVGRGRVDRLGAQMLGERRAARGVDEP
jgi:hypothetical protein